MTQRMNLGDDIRKLVKEYGKSMASDHRFLNVLRDIHDFRYETKTSVLLNQLYKNGTIGTICSCTKENIKETIDAAVKRTHLSLQSIKQEDIKSILYSYAIALDIISQTEYEESISSTQKNPQSKHKEKTYYLTSNIYPLVILMTFSATTFAVTAITIAHTKNWNILSSIFIVLGDFLYFVTLTLYNAKLKPSSINSIEFASLIASFLVIGVKSLMPFFYHDIEAFDATLLFLDSIFVCGLSLVGFSTEKQHYHSTKWGIAFVGTFLILSFISIAGFHFLYTKHIIH